MNDVEMPDPETLDAEASPLERAQKESAARRFKINWKDVGLYIVIGIAVLIVRQWMASPPVYKPEEVAHYGAENIVKDVLKAPATAEFLGVQTIERSGPYFLQEVSVDAENSFGVKLRNRFLVILWVKEDTWHYGKQVAVVEGPLSSREMEAFKKVNGWPE